MAAFFLDAKMLGQARMGEGGRGRCGVGSMGTPWSRNAKSPRSSSKRLRQGCRRHLRKGHDLSLLSLDPRVASASRDPLSAQWTVGPTLGSTMDGRGTDGAKRVVSKIGIVLPLLPIQSRGSHGECGRNLGGEYRFSPLSAASSRRTERERSRKPLKGLGAPNGFDTEPPGRRALGVGVLGGVALGC
jgi:hypothetical protein